MSTSDKEKILELEIQVKSLELELLRAESSAAFMGELPQDWRGKKTTEARTAEPLPPRNGVSNVQLLVTAYLKGLYRNGAPLKTIPEIINSLRDVKLRKNSLCPYYKKWGRIPHRSPCWEFDWFNQKEQRGVLFLYEAGQINISGSLDFNPYINKLNKRRVEDRRFYHQLKGVYAEFFGEEIPVHSRPVMSDCPISINKRHFRSENEAASHVEGLRLERIPVYPIRTKTGVLVKNLEVSR